MKYKVGDKVRVRKDLVLWKQYCGQSFTDTMSILSGKKVIIEKSNEGIYRLVEDENKYAWTDEMLEDIEEEFKLPEKWCIKQCSELKKWGKTSNLNPDKEFDSDRHYYWPKDESLRYWDFEGKSVREEITFDQFKKYVLKESESTPAKEEVKFEVGKWYKHKDGYYGKLMLENHGNKFPATFPSSEYITPSGEYNTSGTYFNISSMIPIEVPLSEIQQYLPENHPDKIKKRTKKAEDLKYPDAVHCSSKEEHYKVRQFANIGDYEGNCYYLLDAESWREEPWTGTCASNPESRRTYANYEFSDIIFPEEKVVDKEDEEFKIGAYIVFIDNFGSSKKGDVDKIKTVYSPEQIILEKEGISWGRLGEGFSKRCKYFLTLEEAKRFSDELLGKNKVETKPMLSKEELLDEAKRRYPVGTVFNAARGGKGEYTVGRNPVFRYNSDDAICIKDYGNGTVYYRGEWAEITSKPFNSPIAEKEVERLSFYVRYNTLFTEDLYNKLVDWCVKNNIYKTRGWSDTYRGLIENGFFIYDSAGLRKEGFHGYGVDNNRQCCINEYSIQQVKELIGYKEAFEKQSKPVAQKKEKLVQTGLSQSQACDSYKYNGEECAKRESCDATGGQHYPKEYVPGSRTEGYMDGIPASERLIIHTGNIGLLRGLYNVPVSPEDCFDSDEIYVPIIKTEVKQIKL